MKRTLTFLNRNLKEMIRDPLLYVFCIGFPMVMLVMFSVIYNSASVPLTTFEPASLLPGIIMFSYTFVMLHMSLLVSKDKSTALLQRLYASPMKSCEFVLGYGILGFLIGIVQSVITILFGYLISLIQKIDYVSFFNCLLLTATQIPILLFFIFTGILFGTLLNDKSAPGICSIIISGAGVLGGCWMPVETMGFFKTFCSYLPFYPSVCLGRIVTEAPFVGEELYSFSCIKPECFFIFALYVVLIILLSIISFGKLKKE